MKFFLILLDTVQNRHILAEPTLVTAILNVDDNDRTLLTRAEILQLHRFDVTNAHSGSEALKLLADHEFDLVILDYEMPGMNGAVLAREIRRARPKVPIIMLSGDEVACRRSAPVDAFLLKDWPIEFFLEVVYMFSRQVHHVPGGRRTRTQRHVKLTSIGGENESLYRTHPIASRLN